MKINAALGILVSVTVWITAVPAYAEAGCDICNWRALFERKPEVVKPQKFKQFVNDEQSIGLQNLNNRAVVRCYNSEVHSAEECAQFFEKNGYVRFKDIPYKTANFDFLKVDTYPTRRWRPDELTSRW